MKEEYEIGKEYSKLSEQKRKFLIKEFSEELRKARAINTRIDNRVDELRKNCINTWDLEKRLSLLKHTYEVGDYVLIKGTPNTDTYRIMRVTELIGNKHYNLFEYLGISCGIQKKSIHERDIVCGAKHLREIKGKIAFADVTRVGKVIKKRRAR